MSDNEPKIHFLPGGNVIIDSDREMTAEEMKKAAEIATTYMDSQNPDYVNELTGETHSKKYALTDKQSAEFTAALDTLFQLSQKYETPMFAVVQIACDPQAPKTPSKVSGVSNTIPPRSSDGFDLVQAIVKLVFEKGITMSEYKSLHAWVSDVLKSRKEQKAEE